ASQQDRRLGVLTVVNWLQTQPGDTLPGRWIASGAQDHFDWRDLVSSAAVGRAALTGMSPRKVSSHLNPGLLVLICADVIRPSIGWLLACPQARRGLGSEMARTRDPGRLPRAGRVAPGRRGGAAGRPAGTDPGCADHGCQGRTGRRCEGRGRCGAARSCRTGVPQGGGERPQPVLLPAATCPRLLGPGRTRGNTGVLRTWAAQL